MLFLICCTGFLFRQCSWRWIAHFLFRGSGSDLNQTSKVFIQLQIPSIITFHNKSLYYASIHCLNAYKSQLRPKIWWTGRSQLDSGQLVLFARVIGVFQAFSHLQPLDIARSHPFTTRLSLQRTHFWNTAHYHCAHSYFKALQIIPGYKKKNLQSWRWKRESPCNINDTSRLGDRTLQTGTTQVVASFNSSQISVTGH